MKKISAQIIQFFVISMIITSCATIFGKSKYPVILNSTPNAANVLITNKKGDTVYSGKTPTTVKLKASSGYFQRQNYEITFSADGFKEKKYTIKSTINGLYFGNILVGGAIGMLIVDPLTGRMWALPSSQENINATLFPLNALHTPSINIINLADLPINQKEKLVLIK
jgi:hypothetical protein